MFNDKFAQSICFIIGIDWPLINSVNKAKRMTPSCENAALHLSLHLKSQPPLGGQSQQKIHRFDIYPLLDSLITFSPKRMV